MAFVVKMCYGGDVRRVRFQSQSEVTLEAIKSTVHENFALDAFVAKYRDEEGDLCTLTAWTLDDALGTCQGLLRLEITALAKLPQSISPRVTSTDSEIAEQAAPAAGDQGRETARTGESPTSVSGSARSGDGEAGFQFVDPPSSPVASAKSSVPPPSDRVVEFAIHTPIAGSSPRGASVSELAEVPAQGESEVVAAEAPAGEGSEVAADTRSDSDADWHPVALEDVERRGQAERGQTDAAGAVAAAADADSAASTADPQTEELAAGAEEPVAQPAGASEVAEEAPQAAEEPAAALEEHTPERAEPAEAEGGEIREQLADHDKVDIVLAAFDVDGDGRLSSSEFAELQRATGGTEDAEAFNAICTELGFEPERGLGAGDLAALYTAYGTLDRDFQAALVRFDAAEASTTAAAEDGASTGAAASSSSSNFRRYVPLAAAIPLAVGAPLLGIPLAFLAARHIRHHGHFPSCQGPHLGNHFGRHSGPPGLPAPGFPHRRW